MKPLIRKANIGYFTDCYERYLESEVNNNISRNDEMFWSNVHHVASQNKTNVDELINDHLIYYYGIGQEVAHEVTVACMNSYLRQVDNVLDLACGHGRGTRHLVNLFPNAKIFAADIDHDGVDFCVEQFGTEGIHLPDDFGYYDFEHKYDVIWSGSLFTHHPRERVKCWIAHICNYLSDNGIFVFTIHSRKWVKEQKYLHQGHDSIKDYHDKGHFFFCHDEQHSLEGHGFSAFNPSQMMEDIKDIDNVRVLSYREACWNELQDVVSVGKPSNLLAQHYEIPRPMVLLP